MKVSLLSAVAALVAGVAGARTLEVSTQLTEHTDWSDEELVIPSGVTLDLNGHDLSVGTVSGAGTLTDSKRYVPLDSVSSTGGQLVRVGFMPGEKSSVELDCTTGAYAGSTTYFGCVWLTRAWMFCLAENSFYYFGDGNKLAPFAANTHINFKIAADGKTTLLNVDTGTVLANGSVNRTNAHTDQDFSLFGTPKGNKSSFTLHSFRLWDDGELVRDYVPARDPDTGAVGVLDRVTRVLQASETAVPLVAGKDLGPAASVGSLTVKSSAYPFAGFSGTVAPDLRMTLASDADWTAAGEVTVSGALDLAGHDLTVASLAGAGRIFDSRRYVPLVYTASTGAQYIKTGYVPGTGTAVELEVMPLNSVRTAVFYFGSAWAYNSWTFGQTADVSDVCPNGFFMFFGSGDNFGNYVGNRRYRLTIARDGKAQLDALEGEPHHASKTLNLANSGYEMCVFGGNNARLSTLRIYGFKVWDSDVPKFDFVPAREPDTGKVGLLDRVSGRLFTSETATPLVAGEDAGPARSVGTVRFVGDGRMSADFTGTIEAEAVWTLSDDADWTADGVVDLRGRTVDLAGHVLKVSGLSGDGEIVDSRMLELLDGVQSTQAQYVKTGKVLGTDSSVEIDLTTGAYHNGDVFFGSTWAANAWMFCSAEDCFYFFGGGNKLCPFAANRRVLFSVGTDGKARLRDAETGERLVAATTVSRANNGKETCVFGPSDSASRLSDIRVHAFRIWEGGRIVRDFIPVRDPETQKVGLYDRVDRELHASATSAPLVAGVRVGFQSRGGLRIVPAKGSSFAAFAGTVAEGVRLSMAGDETLVLQSDLDLRPLGEVAVDAKVELGGCELKLASLEGCGEIVDSHVRAYDLYDFVASTKEQYVNTGFTPGEKTTAEMDLTVPHETGSKVFFGCAWGGSAWMFCETAGYYYFFGDTTQLAATRPDAHLAFAVGADGKARLTDADTGELLGEKGVSRKNTNGELRIFGYESTSWRSSFKLHAFKVRDDGEPKFDFIPAKELATGKVGLLDRISGEMFASATATPLVGGTVTNDLPGTLTVDVAEGVAVTNRFVALSGSLRLVKAGAGTLSCARVLQTYGCGTLVESGTLETPFDPTSPATFAGSDGYFGAAGSRISVAEGAVFDYKGNSGYSGYQVVLGGGTLRNGGIDADPSLAGLGSMKLAADSAFDLAADAVYRAEAAMTFDLGGHAYAVATGGKALRFVDATTVTSGRLELSGGGLLDIRGTFAAKDVDLRTDGSIALSGAASVRDYFASAAAAENSGGGALNVFGTFTPAGAGFYGCTMQDGSTVDLGGCAGEWSTVSSATGGRTEVTFAKGATVTLDFGGRDVSGRVVSWATPPDGVAFEVRGAAYDAGKRLSIREDGLYAADGLMILYR